MLWKPPQKVKLSTPAKNARFSYVKTDQCEILRPGCKIQLLDNKIVFSFDGKEIEHEMKDNYYLEFRLV